MYDIITVGSATVDVFAHTDFSEVIKIKEPNGEVDLLAYPLGSKLLIKELRFTTGGGGTNTAVAFARLGLKTAWIGKIGDDGNADVIVKELEKDNVEVLAARGKGHSGFSVILDSIVDDRTILVYKGVNDELRFSEIPVKKIKTKWFYFSSMMGESFKTMERLAVFAEKKGVRIAFNASNYLAKKGARFLRGILSRTEIFVLNDEEAMLIAGEKEIEKQFFRIHGMGPKVVVITMGAKGAAASEGKNLYMIKPSRDVKVVETTGAGDAFAAGFVAGIIKRGEIEFALRLGKANAESVIGHHGAKNRLLRYKEALSLMRRNFSAIKKKRIYA